MKIFNWKKFNESNESFLKDFLKIKDEEVDLFSSQPALSKLIEDEKVSLLGNKLIYNKDDQETLEILDLYLEINN
jgi:hypothetical protein